LRPASVLPEIDRYRRERIIAISSARHITGEPVSETAKRAAPLADAAERGRPC
jgi:hypothetical protein